MLDGVLPVAIVLMLNSDQYNSGPSVLLLCGHHAYADRIKPGRAADFSVLLPALMLNIPEYTYLEPLSSGIDGVCIAAYGSTEVMAYNGVGGDQTLISNRSQC